MQSESTYVLKTKALYKLVNNSLSSVFSDLKLQKAKKTFLFINKNLAVNIVDERTSQLASPYHIVIVQEKSKYITDFHFFNLFRSVPVTTHAQ